MIEVQMEVKTKVQFSYENVTRMCNGNKACYGKDNWMCNEKQHLTW